MPRLVSSERCFGGEQRLYSHRSSVIGLRMRFSVFLPPQAISSGGLCVAKIPALVWLAGLTCNEESFMSQAGAQRYAVEHGVALIAPDTSPRHARIAGEGDDWEVGLSAGYWLDATQAPWATHYRMESYLIEELLPLLVANLPIAADKLGVFGHSVGGHGALSLALRHPSVFRSLSAFAPVCALTQSPWGEKACTAYLGEDRASWLTHDASALMAQKENPFPEGILIDQGLADKFMPVQLLPETFTAACEQAKQALTLRYHAGYDHNYYFIASFMADHVAHHAAILHAN